MSHADTEKPETPSWALALVGAPAPARAVPARPLAPFLVQLIDGPAGSLRPPRNQRSREASERYAAGAKRMG
ncbi:hypothetical protein [Methylobacterium sp. ID0610]|uniref:hypothetical protein n=1 Tax=Methylobacterium carpenticola TaxID=3344827 RepID=UPI0036B8D497